VAIQKKPNSPGISNTRTSLRSTIRKQRQQLTPAARAEAAATISQFITNTAWFRRARHIAFYHAVAGEVDPHPLLLRAHQLGKTCYLPVCHPLRHNKLLFVRYQPGDKLIYNRYGIPEPDLKTQPCRKPYALDLVFVPLLAVDEQGNRLGSGQGFYDRTFSYLRRSSHRHKPQLIGLAYDFQKVAALPVQPWDVPLDHAVIVEDY
jgi:5-formyltetrahydrofolate cyclo-ligase